MKKTPDFKKESKLVKDRALKSLEEFIKIDTVFDEKTVSKDHPFGIGVQKGLDYVAELGKKLGFDVDRCDNYCTELSYGEGDKLIDIYAHADVVPVSKTWKTDPFFPTIKNGTMYARGCADDKGPGISALYGAEIVKDHGGIDGYRLRIIFGGNEERGSACLHHYFHEMKKGYPDFGFSPDADYPLIYAEKGIYTYKATYHLDSDKLPKFKYGDATNIVLGETFLTMEDDVGGQLKSYLAKNPEIKATFNTKSILHFIGKACHGSMPWNGINAGLYMLDFLGGVYDLPILHQIFTDYATGDGKAFGGDYKSETFDSSSYCIGVMEYDGKDLTVLVNMRLPENVTAEAAIKNAEAKTKADSVELLGGSEGLMFPLDSDLVRILLKSYQDQSGDLVSKPLAIGGGTYARDSKNSVAFGMQFPNVDSKMHEDGEFMRIDDFNRSIAIYADAIWHLGSALNGNKE